MPTVAYLGPEKTNAHLAARKKFGPKAGYKHVPTVEDVFWMVETSEADFGVVPIENSLEGAVTHTLDQFIGCESPARIFGEIEVPIQHYLIRRPQTSIGMIRVIFSHPQALAQCREWLGKHFHNAQLVETLSTADAVDKMLADPKHPLNKFRMWKVEECAAIGRIELAEEYDLKAISIPTGRENRTRFLIISQQKPKLGKHNKTSLLVVLKDRPGALQDALLPFKQNKINLTKIESRPSKRKAWEYIFFIDLEGHESEPRVKKALNTLKRSVAELRVLGSYPAGDVHGRG